MHNIGTIKAIIEDKLKSVLKAQVLTSYKSQIIVNTSVNLSKMFLSEMVKCVVINSFFITRVEATGVNNYIFKLKETEEGVKKSVSEYIRIGVEFLEKFDMMNNRWSIVYEGNRGDLLVPFICMLMALIKKLHNLISNPRFRPFNDKMAELSMKYSLVKSEDESAKPVADKTLALSCSHENNRKTIFIKDFMRYAHVIPSYTKIVQSTNRPIARRMPVVKMANGEDEFDDTFVTKLLYFCRSIGLNPIFVEDVNYIDIIYIGNSISSPKNVLNRVKIYVSNIENRRTLTKVESEQIETKFSNKLITSLTTDGEEGKRYINLDAINGRQIRMFKSTVEVGKGKKGDANRTLKTEILFNITVIVDDCYYQEYPYKMEFKGLYACKQLPHRGIMKNIEPLSGLPRDSNRLTVAKFVTGNPIHKLHHFSLLEAYENYPSNLRDFDNSKPDTYDEQRLERTFAKEIKEIFNDDRSLVCTLLSQHMWDVPFDERWNHLDKLDVYKHQDLLQFILEVRIIYFVYDKDNKSYIYKEPRHSGWYAVDTSYPNCIVVFLSEYGKLEYPVFVPSTATTVGRHNYKIDSKRVDSVIKTGLSISKKSDKNNMITIETIEQYWKGCTMVGQFIDSNGKCVGFRINYEGATLEAKISPQALIYKRKTAHKYIALFDIKSEYQITQKFRVKNPKYSTDDIAMKNIDGYIYHDMDIDPRIYLYNGSKENCHHR